VFVSDLSHYLDLPDTVPAPARRLAGELGLIVQTATSRNPGLAWVSALGCPRRPNHQRCSGTITVARTGTSISWECTACHDDGIITGWKHSLFDLSTYNLQGPAGALRDACEIISVVISPEVVAILQGLTMLDETLERVVFQTGIINGVAVLTGTEDQIEDLVEHIAAEANHAPNRRQQKLLDAAYETLTKTNR
jgi:hypothetical protein